MHRVHVLIHPEGHSTGHYFAAAAEAAGFSVSVDFNGRGPWALGLGGFLLYVDPGPRDFPLDIHAAKCLRMAYLIDVHQDLRTRLDHASLFDLVFVAQRDYVDEFRRRGYLNTHWLPLACDPGTHYVAGLTRNVEVGFVGKLGLVGTRRHALLTGVLSRFQTNQVHRYYSPIEMGEVYSRSKIVLNASINGDLNMRVFEGMAAGALLVTDRIQNGLADLFDEGEHYIGYSSVEEALDRITYYLQNTSERDRISRAGQARVFARHTYGHRWAKMAESGESGGGYAQATRPALSSKELTLTYGRILEARRDFIGLIELIRRNGLSLPLVIRLVRAVGKSINARVPLTPNAIRHRLKAP